MSHWPVYFGDADVDTGTVYVPPPSFHRIIEARGYRGQAWKLGHEYTSYVPNQRLVYKSTKRLAFTSEEDFWGLMARCQSRNLKPPSSYSDLFFQHYRVPLLPSKTCVAPFRSFTFGGWSEALWKGPYHGPVWQYDLTSAYRWAATTSGTLGAGLPDVRTARRSFRFTDPCGLYLVELDAAALPYAPYDGVHVVTSEERDFFGLRPRAVRHGVRFDRMHDMTATFQGLDVSWPRDTVKKMSRAFWGKFNTPEGPLQCTWARGPKEHQHANHLFNPIWAAFITSRVKLRLAAYRQHALHVCVDALLSKEELPAQEPVDACEDCILRHRTNPDCPAMVSVADCGLCTEYHGANHQSIGSFRLVQAFGQGVYIKATNWWKDGPADTGKWWKHAGVRYNDGRAPLN